MKIDWDDPFNLGSGSPWKVQWNKPGKGKNPISIEKRKEKIAAAATRRKNAGPAGEAPSGVFSTKHVKKRRKKAATKAKKYGAVAEKRSVNSGRGDSAVRNSTPKRRAWSPDAPKPTKEERQEDRTSRRKARRAVKKAHLTSAAVRRTQNDKRKSENYKGKYFGPDEFKGDQKKINKWKMAGKPKNKSKFV